MEREITLHEALAEIGVEHQASKHASYRELITADGQIIDTCDWMGGWDFVHAAQAAA